MGNPNCKKLHAPAQGQSKGQTSLEALLSFAVLLAALCILCFSAQRMANGFSGSIELSKSRAALSYDALAIDTAADALPGSQMPSGLSCVPIKGSRGIAAGGHPTITEPLFHMIFSSQEGNLYVQKNPAEPV